jgi:uncharacterized membrane protein YsdA (DUF1294 family)
MSLLLPLAAALVFSCDRPSHHDGDAIRCRGMEQSMRLYGIDAPEMPGACRPGRRCTPGDPYAARDHLRALTRGRNVRCEELDMDSYGRPVVRCTADGEDLSCAMVASGHAVERYGRLDCTAPARARVIEAPPPEPEPQAEPAPSAPPDPPNPAIIEKDGRYFAPPDAPVVRRELGVSWFVSGAWLLLINIMGWSAMDIDKARNRSFTPGSRPSGPGALLLLAIFTGGAPGVLAAQHILEHRLGEQPFSGLILVLTGVEVGAILGIVTLSML